MRYQGTHAEQILAAAGALKQRGVPFRRRDVRDELGLTQAEWMRSYVATFQGIREDRPSNKAPTPSRLRDVFRRVSPGEYVLTPYGEQQVRKLPD